MPPTTPVRGSATSADDAPIAPRRGRPPKPTEKIREAQANLERRTAGARATTQRTIQQNHDGPRTDTGADEELKGYRAVIQALSSELKEARKERQTQILVIQELQGKVQNIGGEVKDVGEETRRMGMMLKTAGEDARKGWEEAKRAREEAQLAREEIKLAREETRLARDAARGAARAAEEKVETFQNEMGAIKEEFRTSLQKLASELSALSSQPPSWASVAARGMSSATSPRVSSPNTSQGTSQSISPYSSISQEKAAGLMGIGLELGTMQNPDFDVRSIAALKLRLRQAFDSHAATNAIPITGLSKKGDAGTSYRIRVGGEENVKKVKGHREWILSHFQGAKMKEDNEYLVVVDGVDKETICDQTKTAIRDTAHEDIGKENGISISKIRFLGQGNPGKSRCSVILHMQDKHEADQLTSRQYMEFGDEMVFTRKYVPRVGPQRCFKCQRVGSHKARDCPNVEETCERCGTDGHKIETCTSPTARCVNCGSDHMASDRRCPALARHIQGVRLHANE